MTDCNHVMDNEVRMGGTHPMTCVKCKQWFTFEEGMKYDLLEVDKDTLASDESQSMDLV